MNQIEITKSGTFAGLHLEEVRLAFRQDFSTSMIRHTAVVHDDCRCVLRVGCVSSMRVWLLVLTPSSSRCHQIRVPCQNLLQPSKKTFHQPRRMPRHPHRVTHVGRDASRHNPRNSSTDNTTRFANQYPFTQAHSNSIGFSSGA